MVFNYTPINITSFCLHPLDEHLLVYTFKKKKLTFSVNVRVYVVRQSSFFRYYIEHTFLCTFLGQQRTQSLTFLNQRSFRSLTSMGKLSIMFQFSKSCLSPFWVNTVPTPSPVNGVLSLSPFSCYGLGRTDSLGQYAAPPQHQASLLSSLGQDCYIMDTLEPDCPEKETTNVINKTLTHVFLSVKIAEMILISPTKHILKIYKTCIMYITKSIQEKNELFHKQ